MAEAKRLKALEQENARLKKAVGGVTARQGSLGGGAAKKIPTPRAQREAVAVMQSETAISERRACALTGIYRSTVRYQPRQTAGTKALSGRIIELAQERSRFGYRRIHALLRREGHTINHKRVYRLYSAANLAVRRRRKRKGVMLPREPLALPLRRNEVWSMDFVMDALANGRRINTDRPHSMLGYRTPAEVAEQLRS